MSEPGGPHANMSTGMAMVARKLPSNHKNACREFLRMRTEAGADDSPRLLNERELHNPLSRDTAN